jgi:hypothetical protein
MIEFTVRLKFRLSPADLDDLGFDPAGLMEELEHNPGFVADVAESATEARPLGIKVISHQVDYIPR